MHGRKRASRDGFALEVRLVQSPQLARGAQATAHGRRMVGARGVLPGYTSEILRQPRAPHRTVAERILGAPLWMEKWTLHELLSWMHNDLLTSNEKGKISTALCQHRLSSRDEGDW